MKRNLPPSSLYNSDNPPQNQNGQSQNNSPYLKEILSGKTKLFTSENSLSVINADRLAALRYIKDSALIKKIYFGKMSC